jgi:signal transduction histidine kinase
MVPRGREQELLTMGLKEIERLDHMIENVLISGRLRTEWYRLEDETVQLRGILDSFIAHRRLYMSGGQGTIELKWEPEEPDLSVRCDRKAVLVILENLTDNAQKYSTDTPEVTVAVRWDGRGVMVAVEDKGIGFEPGLAEKLFMPFVRAAGPGVDSRHGTGLGLAISRSLARRMGGDLKAESGGPGKGSCFTLILKGTRA